MAEVLSTLFHNPAVEWLRRSSIVRIEFRKCLDLLGRHLDRGLEHEPSYSFCARRCRHRSEIDVISGCVSGEQFARIDLDSRNLLLTFSPRHMLPHCPDRRVRVAWPHKHSDPGNFSVARLVHQMSLHLVGLAVDVFFAWMMKVELDEFVVLSVRDQKISVSRVVIHPDRMAIVSHISQRAEFGFEL